MLRLTAIGNLTSDPRSFTTQTGREFASFSVACNRKAGGQETADFVQVTAWRNPEKRDLGGLCLRFLRKGSKVLVEGYPSARAYAAHDGTQKTQLGLTLTTLEFLSPKSANESAQEAMPQADTRSGARLDTVDPQTGFDIVSPDDLPF